MTGSVTAEQSDFGSILIWIDNPDRKNALTDGMVAEMRQILRSLESDRHCRTLVLRGKHAAFCAGRDVSGPPGAGIEPALRAIVDLLNAIKMFPRPTIAAVEGPAVGIGMALAQACDLVIATEQARFGVPEAKLGLTPSLTALSALTALPRKVALEVMFAGRLLSAPEALRHGLVNQTAEVAVFDGAIRKLVEDISALSPNAIKRAKHLVLAAETLDPVTATEQAIAVACASVTDPDAAEGIAAFREKRKPRWSEDC